MTFGAATKSGLRNLTNFRGRSTRAEFWWYYLFITLVGIPVVILISVIGFALMLPALANADPVTGEIPSEDVGQFIAGLLGFYGLLFLFSGVSFFLILAAWVRRLHDAGYSGHWLWLSLAGLSIVPLIFAILDTQVGANQWGEDPKAAERASWAGNPAPYAAPPVTYAAPPVEPPPYPAATTEPPAAASGDSTDPFAAPPR